MRRGLPSLVALCLAALVACSGADRTASPPTPEPSTAEGVQSEEAGAPPTAPTTTTATAPVPETTSTTTTGSPASNTTTAQRAVVTTVTTVTTTPPVEVAGYESSVSEIDSATAARMTASWRAGCPVPLRELRLVRITHWGFDEQPRPGELVVHSGHAEAIRRAFADLFAARFPIEQVRLIDEFGGDDDRSMAANNTSAFNCRYVKGSTRWSQHAVGRAIDINPVQNPYVTRGGVDPPAGRDYLRRDGSRQGVITANGPVVKAFARIGWGWGGRWVSPDYQHFSASGR
jgi:hypothetical protein